MKLNSSNLLRLILLIFFVGWTIFFYYSSPGQLIEHVGIENAYAFMFVLALLGGLTTFSGIPYHAILVVLASGGLNPLLVGFSAAGGVMIGDATSYYLGYHGRAIIPTGISKFLERLYSFCSVHPNLLPLFFFLYGSLVPFSNDFIVISMGLARYPFWKVMVPLGFGNLVFNISLAYLSVYAYQFISSLSIWI